MTEPTLSVVVSQDTHRTSIARMVAIMSLGAFLVFFQWTVPAQAQLYAGSVTGVIADQTGGLITGADVTLADAEKGFTFTSKTDTNGRYLFRSVAPGTYNISVNATGFKEQNRTGIRVDVSQNVGVDFAWTQIAISTTSRDCPSPRCAATILAEPLVARSSRTRLSFSSTTRACA